MNKQEIFDRVVPHARKQGVRSRLPGDNGSCAYRGADGRRCFIGALIPDESYDENMEGSAMSLLFLNEFPQVKQHIFGEKSPTNADIRFLVELQQCHDRNFSWEWETIFCSIATNHDLVYTEAPL